jgi:hypothetical protein
VYTTTSSPELVIYIFLYIQSDSKKRVKLYETISKDTWSRFIFHLAYLLLALIGQWLSSVRLHYNVFIWVNIGLRRMDGGFSYKSLLI